MDDKLMLNGDVGPILTIHSFGRKIP